MILIHNLTPQIVIGKSVSRRWRLNCKSNQSLILNQWHHVAFSVDNFGKCKLFIDGKVVGEAKFNDTVNKLPTSNLVIGAEADGSNKLVGQLQDVRISTVSVYSDDSLFQTHCIRLIVQMYALIQLLWDVHTM